MRGDAGGEGHDARFLRRTTKPYQTGAPQAWDWLKLYCFADRTRRAEICVRHRERWERGCC
jgi:hypothetical protein